MYNYLQLCIDEIKKSGYHLYISDIHIDFLVIKNMVQFSSNEKCANIEAYNNGIKTFNDDPATGYSFNEFIVDSFEFDLISAFVFSCMKSIHLNKFVSTTNEYINKTRLHILASLEVIEHHSTYGYSERIIQDMINTYIANHISEEEIKKLIINTVKYIQNEHQKNKKQSSSKSLRLGEHLKF